MLGPLSVTIRSPASLELVAALELVAQLPELPCQSCHLRLIACPCVVR